MTKEMTMNKALLCSLLLILSGGAHASETSMTVKYAERMFNEVYPRVDYRFIGRSAVEGLFEVVAGENIFYFHPESGNLIFGEIFTKEGRSLTALRRASLTDQSQKGTGLYPDAIRIGSGPNVIVEISDPDCPFCRRASAYFKHRNNITRYVYLYPLPTHPDAEAKTKYILCSDDRARAYEEVFSGHVDNRIPEIPQDCNADALLEAHINRALRAGVQTTPTFWVNGRHVEGLDIGMIEANLNH